MTAHARFFEIDVDVLDVGVVLNLHLVLADAFEDVAGLDAEDAGAARVESGSTAWATMAPGV